MKRIWMSVAFLVVILSFGFGVQAAEKSVTVNPLGLILGIVSGEYEQKLSSDVTFAIKASLWSPPIDELEVSVAAIGVGARKYVGDQALDGLYLGGYGMLASTTVNAPDETISNAIIGLIGQVGYKWLSSKGFTIDLGAILGLPLVFSGSPEDAIFAAIAAGTIGLGINLGLGYTW